MYDANEAAMDASLSQVICVQTVQTVQSDSHPMNNRKSIYCLYDLGWDSLVNLPEFFLQSVAFALDCG